MRAPPGYCSPRAPGSESPPRSGCAEATSPGTLHPSRGGESGSKVTPWSSQSHTKAHGVEHERSAQGGQMTARWSVENAREAQPSTHKHSAEATQAASPSFCGVAGCKPGRRRGEREIETEREGGREGERCGGRGARVCVMCVRSGSMQWRRRTSDTRGTTNSSRRRQCREPPVS